MKRLKVITPKNQKDFRTWLSKNHRSPDSHWVQIFKKSSPKANISSAQITKECLCFGWIDGLVNKGSDEYYFLLISPRKPKSVWSKKNKDTVKLLIDSQQMRAPGLKVIERAKANGSWDQLNRSDSLEVPTSLKEQLKKHPKALTFFQALSPSAKKLTLAWIYDAKTDKTHQKRVHQTIALAKLGIRVLSPEASKHLKTMKDKT